MFGCFGFVDFSNIGSPLDTQHICNPEVDFDDCPVAQQSSHFYLTLRRHINATGKSLIHRCNLSDGSTLIVLGILYYDLSRVTCIRDFEDHCDGAFTAFHIQKNSVSIFRDPAGYRCLYIHPNDEKIFFSSNIRWFQSALGLKLQRNPGRVVDFLCTSFIPGIECFASGVLEVPMGHKMLCSGNPQTTCQYEIHDYCRFGASGKINDMCEEEASQALWDTSLKNMGNIQSFTNEKAPVVFLSGGLDSTSALCLANEFYQTRDIKTLSVNFGKDLPNENEFIDIAGKYFHNPHEYIAIYPEVFIPDMEDIYTWIDEPVGDPVVMPNYIMNKAMGPENSLIITGEGGDPCFGGPKNVFMLATEAYSPMFADSADPAFLALAYLDSFRRAFDELHSLVRLPQSQISKALAELVSLINSHISHPGFKARLDQLLFTNKFLKCSSLILPKVQKTTQPFGHLSLSPLYSRKIIDLCAVMPASVKYKNLQEKYILKKTFSGKIPYPIIQRRKSGMRVPLKFWNDRKVRNFHSRVLTGRHRDITSSLFNMEAVKFILNNPVPRQGLKIWMLSSIVLTTAKLYES